MESSKKQTPNENLKKLNEKYANDPSFREKIKKTYREKYQTDADYKEKTLERSKNRYHSDPEYRKSTIERAKKRYREKKISETKRNNTSCYPSLLTIYFTTTGT